MEIRPFHFKDAKEISSIIQKTLFETNSRYYQKSVLNYLSNEYSPDNLIKMAEKKELFVAIDNGIIIGVAAVEDNDISTVFILPEYQNQGIGKKLMKKVEDVAKNNGFREVKLNASINALEFYKKIGYKKGKRVEKENLGVTYEMIKEF